MTDKTYPQLDAFDGLTGAEICALHQDGRLVRLTLTELAQWIKTAESIVPASEPFEGVLLERTTDLANISFPVFVPWQAADYDTMGFWSGAAPTRITVPPGVSKGRIVAAVKFNSSGGAGSLFTSINKNGAGMKFNFDKNIREGTSGYGNNATWTFSAVISVQPGDYFELRVNKAGMAAVDTIEHNSSTFFAFEVVEKSP